MDIAVGLSAWFCFGLVAGSLAFALAAKRGPLGGLVPFTFGIVGGIAGGFLGWLITGSPLHPAAWVLSMVAAAAAAAGFVLATGRRGKGETRT